MLFIALRNSALWMVTSRRPLPANQLSHEVGQDQGARLAGRAFAHRGSGFLWNGGTPPIGLLCLSGGRGAGLVPFGGHLIGQVFFTPCLVGRLPPTLDTWRRFRVSHRLLPCGQVAATLHFLARHEVICIGGRYGLGSKEFTPNNVVQTSTSERFVPLGWLTGAAELLAKSHVSRSTLILSCRLS